MRLTVTIFPLVLFEFLKHIPALLKKMKMQQIATTTENQNTVWPSDVSIFRTLTAKAASQR